MSLRTLTALLSLAGISAVHADMITVTETIGDSASDFVVEFPAAGVPDSNGWNYGYYDYTNDPGGSGTYSTGEFIQFTAGQTRGSGYGIAGSGEPWLLVGPGNDGHPEGANGAATTELWAVRRFTLPAQASLTAYPQATAESFSVDWNITATNVNGLGATLNVYQNGTQIATGVTDDDGGVLTVSGSTALTYNDGDLIDFALTPEDNSAARDDGSDGSDFGGSIVRSLTFETMSVIADSDAEFGGTQGGDDWTNGYYNITTNGMPVDGTSFIPFAGGDGGGPWDGTAQQWTGTAWDLQTASAQPWTFLNGTGGHPNGTNQPEEHWVTRRWTVPSGESGDLLVEFELSKPNGAGGTTLFVLHNGVEVGSIASNSADLQDGFAVISGAQAGDTIDFALSPLFGGDTGDGSDSSNFNGTIHLLVPEPSTGLLLLGGLTISALIRRRR